MKIEGSESLAAERAQVFGWLSDPETLRRCAPGLESLEQSGRDRLEAVLELRLPALTGRFEGTVAFLERETPSLLCLEFSGRGRLGFLEGQVRLDLSEADPGTRVDYAADVQVGGQVARLGQRMLSGVAKEMAGQFFEALAREAGPDVGRPTSGPGPLRALLQLAWRTLLELLGRSRRG